MFWILTASVPGDDRVFTIGSKAEFPEPRPWTARGTSPILQHYFASQCDYCGSSIVSGQRWVREKIFDPALNSRDAHYHWYHAEPFEGQEGSCWAKHEMEREIVRTTAYAA